MAKADKKPKSLKSFQMAVSVDLIGSKMSMSASKNITLQELPHGIRMKSKASRRSVVIPWSNVKGYEEIYQEDDNETQE